MFKGKFVVLSVLAALLICWQFLPMNTNSASSGIVSPCSSETYFCGAGDRCWFICPQGDGNTLASGGNTICVHVEDQFGNPIAGILATDFWLVGCTDLYLCAGAGSIGADSATNANGNTTISGTMFAGGCDLVGVHVVVQGVIVGCPPTCLSMIVVSPDLDADGDVDLVDFAIFAPSFNKSLGHPSYNPCCDFDCDGDVDLVDFSIFAQHWQHSC
ncbi:MAG: Ig-like domain-containing protein [Candidatus Latescibacterota bacterium]